MEDTLQKKDESSAAAPTAVEAVKAPTPIVAPVDANPRGRERYGGQRQGGQGRDFKRNPRRGGKGEGKPRAEFDQKIIAIRRVARVVAGGRRFSFSVVLVAGNRKGSVGVGIGKAGDTSLAIEKSFRNAKRNMRKLNLTKEMSLPHEVEAKYGSARIVIRPAPGRGVVAGSSARIVIELAGIKNVTSKILSGSKNTLTIARAAVVALEKLRQPRKRAEVTGTVSLAQ